MKGPRPARTTTDDGTCGTDGACGADGSTRPEEAEMSDESIFTWWYLSPAAGYRCVGFFLRMIKSGDSEGGGLKQEEVAQPC